jgi:opacity protein-like surface antigen
MKNILLSSTLLFALSTAAFAGGDLAPETAIENSESSEISLYNDKNFYWGIGYSRIDLEVETERNYDAVTFIGGYKLHKYLSTELRYSYASDDTHEVSNKALYLKPQYALNDNFEVYALLGYGEIVARQTSGTGLQWGIGAEYFVSNGYSIFVDYTSLYDDTLEEVSNIKTNSHESTMGSINIGVNYYF